MTTTAPVAEHQTFTITEDIAVSASLERTFQSLVAQMGRLNEAPDGTPLPMILETHPGGRWYRDLGGDNGHLWGFVQSIKRPVLLEIWGPLFMSTAATYMVRDWVDAVRLPAWLLFQGRPRRLSPRSMMALSQL